METLLGSVSSGRVSCEVLVLDMDYVFGKLYDDTPEMDDRCIFVGNIVFEHLQCADRDIRHVFLCSGGSDPLEREVLQKLFEILNASRNPILHDVSIYTVAGDCTRASKICGRHTHPKFDCVKSESVTYTETVGVITLLLQILDCSAVVIGKDPLLFYALIALSRNDVYIKLTHSEKYMHMRKGVLDLEYALQVMVGLQKSGRADVHFLERSDDEGPTRGLISFPIKDLRETSGSTAKVKLRALIASAENVYAVTIRGVVYVLKLNTRGFENVLYRLSVMSDTRCVAK